VPNTKARLSAELPDANQVAITRCGRFLVIKPACPHVFRELQTIILQDLHHDDGIKLRKRRWRLFGVESDLSGEPVLVFPAGLEPLVCQLLERAGIACDPPGPRCDPLPPPDGERLQNLRHVDAHILETIRSRDQVLLRIDRDHVHLDELIAQMVLAWPQTRVRVAVKSTPKARLLAGLLRQRGLHPMVIRASSALSGRKRNSSLVVCTFRALGLVPGGVEMGDITIVPEAAHDLERGRLIGLLATDTRLATFEADRLLQIFGPAVDLPRHGCSRLPIRVAWLPIIGGPPIPEYSHPSAIKRNAIWLHPVRNRRIAQLARALSAGDANSAIRLVPALVKDPIVQAPARAIILTENVEHALVLAEQLPAWPVLTAEEVSTAGLSARQRQVLQHRTQTQNAPAGLIATAAGLSPLGHPLWHFAATWNVVLRADGGTGLPPLASWQAIDYLSTARLLVIDCDDRHHPELQQRTRRRQRAYSQDGWILAGMATTHPELAQFLASRPWFQGRR
jgi:hypothetical protein